MKTLKTIVWILVAVIIVAGIGVYGYLKSTLPEYDGELSASGLSDTVEIVRDSYGMPHIYAETDHDAYFALGYAVAQDRLFQMDIFRRAFRGRLSEILGEGALGADTLFLTVTADNPIDELYEQYPPEVRDAMAAFADGVNCYLETRNGPLPVEFTLLGYEPEPWKPADCAAVYYLMSWDLNSSFTTELLFYAIVNAVGEEAAREIIVEYPDDAPFIMTGLPFAGADNTLDLLNVFACARMLTGTEGGGVSNNWVLSGEKTDTGMPILANDMHLGHSAPGIWYEAHLVTPTMNVSGVMPPGIPVVTVGATEHVAWGFTNVMADDSDYYMELIDPDDPNRYYYNGRWEEMETVEHTIPVKGGDPVTHTVRITRHGPIVNDVNEQDEPEGYALAMRWTAPELFGVATALYYFNHAENVDDFEKGIEYFKCPAQNIVYADDQGNIGYWASVGIPIRGGAAYGTPLFYPVPEGGEPPVLEYSGNWNPGILPVPGWDDRYEWRGYVPTDGQPHTKNPPRGWIATANNKHVDDDYPYLISNYYATPYRFARISEMIEEKDELGVVDMQRMHADVQVLMAREWVPVMEAALSGAELSDTEARALELLSAWDYEASVESPACSIFHATINAMLERTFKNRLGEDLYAHYIDNDFIAFNALNNMITRGESIWFDDPATDDIEQMNDMITASFTDAVALLKSEMGGDPDTWEWGELHTLTLYHAFGEQSKLLGMFMNIGPYPLWGSWATVNPAPYHITDPWEVYHGASERYIFDMSDINNSLRVIPAGISGNFMSPHYDDQALLWRTVSYRPFVLDRDRVMEDAAYTLTITPVAEAE